MSRISIWCLILEVYGKDRRGRRRGMVNPGIFGERESARVFCHVKNKTTSKKRNIIIKNKNKITAI